MHANQKHKLETQAINTNSIFSYNHKHHTSI